MKSIKAEAGQALVLVMMIITLILLMSSSMLTQGSESHKASFEEKKIVQASYIAEAGAEKTIAQIKNNPLWLKGLALNTDYTYITSMNYASGQITSVIVKRTSFTANPTTFYIESLGEYQGAKRTIQVQGKMYDPVDFSSGVWNGSPPFPVLDQSWYAKNADQLLTGNLSGTFNVDGISYISGNISISGTYSGAGTIVAGGKVTINGNLNRADTNSSLAIISFGSPVGIETSSNLTIYALLYSPNQIAIDNETHIYGSAICDILNIGQNAAVTDDDALQNNQPKWITTRIRITSWKEKYSVF